MCREYKINLTTRLLNDTQVDQRNTVRNNHGYDLFLRSTAAYRENVITNNDSGTVTGGFNMGANFCDTNATCP